MRQQQIKGLALLHVGAVGLFALVLLNDQMYSPGGVNVLEPHESTPSASSPLVQPFWHCPPTGAFDDRRFVQWYSAGDD